MAQTPQQRRANEAFAKAETQKRGKSVTDIKSKKDQQRVSKAPVSQGWVLLLLFVTLGGIAFELIRVMFGAGKGWFS